MNFRYDIVPREGYLSVHCEGDWKESGSRECWLQVVATLERTGLERVLLDNRGIELQTDTGIDYRHAAFVAETVSRSCRRAAIIDTPRNDESNRFFENVCVNRGLRLRFFAEPEAALEWLMP